MKNKFNILDWDSDFFGYKIASIQTSQLHPAELKEILKDLEQQNVTLAYCFVQEDDNISFNSLQKASGLLTDKKVIYVIHGFSAPSEIDSRHIRPYDLNYLSDNLHNLALQSGIYSRYNVDPKFRNNEYERLYLEWIKKSVEKKIADDILVYYDDITERGFITLSVKEDKGTIGLVAVDERERGKSIGRKLMNSTFEYFANRNINTVEVVTQMANKTACLFYESLGFQVKSVTNIFHLWIK